MKRIRLELDSLQVESFTTDHGASLRGTVKGHVITEFTDCWGECTVIQPSERCLNTRVQDRCGYPTTSCPETVTYDEYSCHCLEAWTSPLRCCDGGGSAPAAC